MLTSLDFLRIGEKFPPECELERLDKYNKNKMIFEGKHDQIYAESFKRINRVIGNFDQVVSYSVIANFQKLISLKVADLMLGEPPKITCGNDGSVQQEAIDTIKENSDLINTCYSAAVDISRYGDTVFNVYKDEEGKAIIDITQPNFYFKVVNPQNTRRTIHHVLAHTYKTTNTTAGILGMGKKQQEITYLYVQIHSKGFYEECTFIMNDASIISKLDQPLKKINTGLDDFAIVPAHNLLTSDRIYGIDDYSDLDSIISEIEVRLGQIAKILDKHAEPTMQGPRSAMNIDKNGTWTFTPGTYIPKDPGDSDVGYVTWEAQLEANFRHIEELIKVLSIVSEMGSALLDTEAKQGVLSGAALRRLMISPLAKVNRIRMRFDSSLKKAIKLCSQLQNEGIVNLSSESINITWNSGLPTDPKEEAEVMGIRTGNKATISQWSAIKSLDALSDEDTKKELDAIIEDTKRENPLSNMNFDYTKESDEADPVDPVIEEGDPVD